MLRAAPGNVSFPSGEPSGPPPQGLDGLRSFTLLSSRVTSCGAGPRRGGGNQGRVGRLNKLGAEAGHLQDLPQLLPTLGVRLLASQGPCVGTVMWPQAERSRSLFAEGGKTTCGLLIQPHLSAPGSAASVCPGCLGSDDARLVGVEPPKGAAGGLQARTGWPCRLPGNCVKREPEPPDFADGLGHRGRVKPLRSPFPLLSPQSPHPILGGPLFLARGYESLQVTPHGWV